MGMFLGNINPSSFYFGDKTINKILFKENVVWEKNGGGEVDDVQYLCFTAEEAGSTIKMAKYGSAPDVYLETSPTGEEGSWSDFTVGSTTITLVNVGDKVYFRAKQDNERFGTNPNNTDYHSFVMTGKIAASGNLNTLLKADGSVLDLTGRNYCFAWLFKGCTSLTQAPELPATTLAEWCYVAMFEGCSSLTNTPALPATTLASRCYGHMFAGCSSLAKFPELPATTLTDMCYFWLFANTSSSLANENITIKVTNLTVDCFSHMFYTKKANVFTVDMTACTSVPTLPSISTFSTAYAKSYTVLVPASLYDEWIQATNWSTIKSYIQAV